MVTHAERIKNRQKSNGAKVRALWVCHFLNDK